MMNSKIIFAIFFIVFLFVSGCSWIKTKERMPDEPPADIADVSSTDNQVATTSEESSTSDSEESSTSEEPSTNIEPSTSLPPPAKPDESSTAADAPDPMVMTQPLPITTIPEATEMPADVTPEIQPAPVEKRQKKEDKSAVVEVQDQSAKKLDPNYFILTVTEKNNTHPSFGKGHNLGFVVDDVQGRSLAFKRGEKYELDVRTDLLHDVYLSTSPVGWGGGVVVDGIQGQFTYRGIIEIAPSNKTPDVIYYQCRNHSTMGGKVFVVDKDTSETKINKLLASVKTSKAVAGEGSLAKKVELSDAKVRQKMTFADMMLNSTGTKRVDASDHKEAKIMLDSARKKMTEAKKQLSSGNNTKAMDLADNVLQLVGKSSTLVPSEEVLQERETRYVELLDAVKNFEQSHKISYAMTVKKRGEKAAVDYDKKEIASLLEEANSFAEKRQHLTAIPLLEKAENIVTSALNVMLDSQTIVYDLKFETAEDEYKYELKRFTGYEELVPIAIERKRPAPGAVKLMDGFVAKGRSEREDAIKKAEQGDFPTAIAMMLSATTQVRRALRIAGVSQ